MLKLDTKMEKLTPLQFRRTWDGGNTLFELVFYTPFLVLEVHYCAVLSLVSI